MTRGAFFAQFERHLLVGKPKREEIIAELQSHLAELSKSADPSVAIGDPKQLAREYNRTHLGFFSTWLRLLLPMPLLWLGMMATVFFSHIIGFSETNFVTAENAEYSLHIPSMPVTSAILMVIPWRVIGFAYGITVLSGFTLAFFATALYTPGSLVVKIAGGLLAGIGMNMLWPIVLTIIVSITLMVFLWLKRIVRALTHHQERT